MFINRLLDLDSLSQEHLNDYENHQPMLKHEVLFWLFQSERSLLVDFNEDKEMLILKSVLISKFFQKHLEFKISNFLTTRIVKVEDYKKHLTPENLSHELETVKTYEVLYAQSLTGLYSQWLRVQKEERV